MSESIFETFTDERGNISVRVSQEVQVLTREEADRIEAEYKRMQAENAKLLELVHRLISHVEHPPCEGCMAEMNCDGEHVTQCDEWLFMVADARKLGVEVD